MSRLILAFALATACGCAGVAQTSPSLTRDTSRQLDKDKRFAHSSNGDILYGPSRIDELVIGQRDCAGNIHVVR